MYTSCYLGTQGANAMTTWICASVRCFLFNANSQVSHSSPMSILASESLQRPTSTLQRSTSTTQSQKRTPTPTKHDKPSDQPSSLSTKPSQASSRRLWRLSAVSASGMP